MKRRRHTGEDAFRQGQVDFEHLFRLAMGKKRPHDLLAEAVTRSFSGESVPESKKVAGISTKTWLGIVGAVAEIATGKEIEFDTNPQLCKHNIVVGEHRADSAYCLTCDTAFTRESPHPKCKPCDRCSGPTCVCGCSLCCDKKCSDEKDKERIAL